MLCGALQQVTKRAAVKNARKTSTMSGLKMSNRLGYETIHTMVNLRRQWKLKIKAEHINASRLINDLLGKYWEGEVCKHCYSSPLNVQTCTCGKPRVFCSNNECWDGTIQYCNCNWGKIPKEERYLMKERETVLKGGELAQYGPPKESQPPTF